MPFLEFQTRHLRRAKLAFSQSWALQSLRIQSSTFGRAGGKKKFYLNDLLMPHSTSCTILSSLARSRFVRLLLFLISVPHPNYNDFFETQRSNGRWASPKFERALTLIPSFMSFRQMEPERMCGGSDHLLYFSVGRCVVLQVNGSPQVGTYFEIGQL